MWLLDHNLPHQLREQLRNYSIASDTAAYRGWEQLRNGELVSAAAAAGYEAILTRDLKFAKAATPQLLKYPNMALVVVQLPQRSAKLYIAAFRKAWVKQEISPAKGKVILWPATARGVR